MAPIRVGIIGLSANSANVGWAASAHLPYLQTSSKYELIALCNSSKESAVKAIAHFKLPASTRAYGSSAEMVQDLDIELAVCCTSVEYHYETLLPLIEAGIDVYTEVPLAMNIAKTRQLVALAKKKGIKTMIGMQGQANPAVNKIKKMIDDGKIGRVLSTTILGYAAALTGDPQPSTSLHLFNRAAGANMVTVWFLHTFNYILHTLGELSTFNSILDTVRPNIKIFNVGDPDRKIIKTLHSDTPDRILIQGKFESGALLNFNMEGGSPFPGDPALRWHIVGTKGELMVTNNLMMMDVVHEGARILYLDRSKGPAGKIDFLHSKENGPKPEVIELPKHELAHLQGVAPNVGLLYEAFADGKTSFYADWETGLRRHELMEELFQHWDGGTPFGHDAEYMRRTDCGN